MLKKTDDMRHYKETPMNKTIPVEIELNNDF
jgi:hypothetical protein